MYVKYYKILDRCLLLMAANAWINWNVINRFLELLPAEALKKSGKVL